MTAVQWDPRSIFIYDSSDDILDYTRDVERSGKAFKSGQVKLMLSDLLLFINHYTPDMGKIKLVVAGSVTGEHFAVIVQLLPFVEKIDFWDPRPDLALLREGKPSVLAEDQRIEFFTSTEEDPEAGFLTPEKAQRYADEKNIFFISDLRTIGVPEYEHQWREENDISTLCVLTPVQVQRLMSHPTLTESQKHDITSQPWETKTVGLTIKQKLLLDAEYQYKLTKPESQDLDSSYEIELWNQDSELQRNLLETINPLRAMLKFRLPYYHDKVKLMLGTELSYFDGYIYKQAFTGPHSTETRLVPIKVDGKWSYRSYSLKDYESKLFYYNTVMRDGDQVWLNSINNTREVPDETNGLINSFDTAYLLYVFDRYLTFAGQIDISSDARFINAMALWYWARDTLNTFLKNPIDMQAARDKVLIEQRKKKAFQARPLQPTLSTRRETAKVGVSSKEVYLRKKQEQAKTIRSSAQTRVQPRKVLPPVRIVNTDDVDENDLEPQ